MGLTLKDHDIIKFRNDFTEIWDHLDTGFKASMGTRVVRDLIYNKLKGSNKLKEQLKDYETVDIRGQRSQRVRDGDGVHFGRPVGGCAHIRTVAGQEAGHDCAPLARC